MKLNLKQVPADGTPLDVTAAVDLSSLRFWGEHPIPEPVEAKARFQNRNGVVTVNYTACYTLQGACARCLGDVEQQREHTFRHTLAEEVQDESRDDILVVPRALLDLDELVRADVSLAQEDVLLCSADCKGLCPACGADRNAADCGCSTTEPDHRFDVLRALLADHEG